MLQNFRLLNKGRLFFILVSIWAQQNCLCSALTKMEKFQMKPCIVIFSPLAWYELWTIAKKEFIAETCNYCSLAEMAPLKGTGPFLWVQGGIQSSASVEHLWLALPLWRHLFVFMDAIVVNTMLYCTAVPLLMSSVSWFMVSRHDARPELCLGQGSSIQVPVSVQWHSAEQTGRC